uniref:Uncharacterized protein n=1 Tax=viral metagenome TaxID=1070528 RepID=A0A6M3IJU4_9ZZZZ
MSDKQILVRATKNQIEEFKSSFLWKDIKRELRMWKRGFDQERASIVRDSTDSNPSTATVLMHLGDINGRVETVNYLLSLPDIFIQLLEEQNDSKRNSTD